MFDIEEYTIYLREKETKPNTIKNYENVLNHLNEFCVENEITELTKASILDYRDFIKDGMPIPEKKTKTGKIIPAKGYTIKTYNQKVQSLNAYFNWLNRPELKLKKQKAQTKAHKDSVSYDDFKSILNRLDAETNLFVLVIVNTGMRISEVLFLQKKHLYQSSFEIDNKSTIRDVAINPKLKKMLKKYCEGMDDEDKIFPRDSSTYRKRLKKVAGQSKITLSKVRPHAFRHLFATEFLKRKGDSLVLQQLLGHKDSKTTAIYAEMSKADQINQFTEINNF